jgi:hypothetical protein
MLGHRHPNRLKCRDFLRSRASAALDDGPSMAHTLARRRGPPRNEGRNRLGHSLSDEARSPLLVAAADFADEHHLFGQRILLKQLQHVNEGRTDNGIAAYTDAGALTDATRGERVDDFIGQRTRA